MYEIKSCKLNIKLYLNMIVNRFINIIHFQYLSAGYIDIILSKTLKLLNYFHVSTYVVSENSISDCHILQDQAL